MSHGVATTLRALLLGLGLGLHVAALLRVHALLAGTGPSAGLLAAGAMLAAWALGARARSARPSAGAAAALIAGASAFLAPVPLGLTTGLAAAVTTLVLAALPAGLAGRAAPGPMRPALLLGGAAGLLLAAFAGLPLLGPTTTGLGAAALLALAAALPSARSETGAESAGAEAAEPAGAEAAAPAPGPAVEPLAAWVVAAGVLAALAAQLRPWPFAFAVAGCALLGFAAGAALRLDGARRLAAALAASLLLVPGLLPALGVEAAALVDAPSRPTVAPLWGAVALLLAAFGNGFGGGFVAGLVLPRPRHGALALGGLLLAALALVPATLPVTAASFALVGFAGLLAASLTAPLRRRLDGIPAAAALAFGLLVVLALPSVLPGDTGPWISPGRRVELSFDTGREPPRGRLTLDGHALVRTGPSQRPEAVLAGQLAGLLPPRREAALVIGLRAEETMSALEGHGFTEIALRATSREEALASVHLAGLAEPPAVAPAPSAWPERSGGWDAIVVQAGDPSVPDHAPLFTPSAWRRVADLLAGGGVLVQRLDIASLGPDGLLAVVRQAKEALPETWIATADLGRDGAVQLIARAPQAGGARLPWNRLRLDETLNPRLDERAVRQLESVLLFKPGDLLDTFAAGPRELAELEPEVGPLDPWSPGARALALPAPEEGATQLARAMLYARLNTVELRLDLLGEPATPPWQDHWPFTGVETKLGEGWALESGLLRMANRYRPVLGDFGLYRDLSRKQVWTKGQDGRLEVAELARSLAGPDTVNASARSLMDEHVFRTFDARIHGHRAAGLVRQPSVTEQHLHLTWHCPIQARLYLVDYRVEDAKPGLYQGPLDWLGRSLRCHHPDGPAAPPGP